MGSAINHSFISTHFLLSIYFLTAQTYECMCLIVQVYSDFDALSPVIHAEQESPKSRPHLWTSIVVLVLVIIIFPLTQIILQILLISVVGLLSNSTEIV